MRMTLMLSERAAGEDDFDEELLDWLVHPDCTDSPICRKNGHLGEFAPAATKQEFQLMTASATCLVGCTLSVSFCLEASVNFMEPLSEEQAVHGECIQQLEKLVRQVGPGWEVKVGNSVEINCMSWMVKVC